MPRRLPRLPSQSPAKGLLIVLSGPSGVGKDAVLTRMKETGLPLQYVVTLTTRPKRENENDNVDYHFVCKPEFEALKESGQLLESANVYGNWYGVPRREVEGALEAGKDTIIKVDVQGADNIKRIVPQAVSVFLKPQNKEDLEVRLQRRKTESSLDLGVRLSAAAQEFDKMGSFDYVVVNEWEQIDRAVDDIAWIISVEKCQASTSEPD